MRKLFPLLVLTVFAACQPKNTQNNTDSTHEAGTTADVHGVGGMSSQFYTQLKGTLAGQPVTMQLLRTNANNITGYYVYDKVGEPIKLYNQQDTTGFLVLLEENVAGDGDHQLKGKLENGAFTGNWTNGDKSHPFSLKEDNTGNIQFQVIVESDTTRLRANDPEGPFAASDVTILWPVGGAAEATLKMIRDSITQDSKATFTDGKEYAKSLLNDFAAANMDDIKEMDSIERSPAFAQWWSQQTMNVVWNKYPYLVLENYYYEYTGGAHGNGGSLFTCFDLSKNTVIRPNDVFKPGYEAVVGKALEKAFRKKYGVKDDEKLDEAGYLFNKTIEPNQNFYLTDKVVVFSYTPYEIAAYAAGQISLSIPLSELKTVLK